MNAKKIKFGKFEEEVYEKRTQNVSRDPPENSSSSQERRGSDKNPPKP